MGRRPYTNDPLDLVNTCLNCKLVRCDSGQCIFTKKVDLSNSREKLPPVPDDVVSRVSEMTYYGWQQAAIARELGIDQKTVKRALSTAKRRENKKEVKRVV